MRLERIELRLVRMPLVHPFETSFGRETERECIIVAAYDQGLVGWGECAASAGPWYSYETTTTAWHVLRDFLIPSLLGQEIGEATELVERFAPVRGHNMAKAGLEAAVWDLLAKERGVSLAHLLGKALRPAQGKARDRVEVGVSIGIQESLPALLERIAAFWEEGYRRVKIKIKPGWDRAVVAEVRHVFPDIPLMVDANSAYTLADVDLFKALDEYDLMMIEQPLGYDDLFDHAQLQREIETPLCLDESIQGPEHARWALELGSCRVINIKAGRVGGLTQARRIHDLCQERSVPVWCGGMLETGIGRAANVALASLPNFRLPGDLSASARYYARDLVEPPFVVNPDGTMNVPQGPGIGVAVDEERLEEVTIKKEVVSLDERAGR